MKKLLALLTLVSIVFCFAACGGISKDPEKLEKKLGDKYYSVDVVDGTDNLAAYSYAAFLGILEYDGVETIVSVSSEDGDDGAFFVYCEDATSAKDITKHFEDIIDSGHFADSENIDDYKVERDGKIVIFGHKDIIKDAK